MRAWLCLVGAALLLSGCTSSGPTFKEVLAGSLTEKETTSATAPPAAGRPPASQQRSNGNDDCVTAWEHNAYHYACDPNANY